MEYDKEYNKECDETLLRHIKMQEELIELIRVIDGCFEDLDKFYFYTMKKKMLACSTNN